MTQDQLLERLKTQLRLSAGAEGGEIAKERQRALDYYFGRVRGDEVPGRSAVVSQDLSAMVEANLAQILDAFSSNAIADFEPLGPDDEDQAQLEADTVSYFVMSRNNGFLHLGQAIKEALLLRNGVMKVWVEERRRTTTKRFEGVTPDALAELTQKPGLETKVLSYDPEAGELHIRLTKVDREFRSESLPLENFRYTADWDRHDLQSIPFVAERHVDRRSDLVEFGFSKAAVGRLTAYKVAYDAVAAAKNPRRIVAEQEGIDTSQDLIEWYEAYVLIDKDGDGIAERRKVCFAQNEILDDVPVNLVPYAAGVVIVNPNRFMGISLYDKLKPVQDVNTALTRALLDNVNTTTKARVAVLDGKVPNPEDLTDGRPNGVIRIKGVQDVRAAIVPFEVPDTSANIRANIEYQKHVRTELGGAALEMASGQMQLSDRVGSQGLDRAYSVMEQLASMMTKNIAATLIRSTFLLAHATLRENFSEPVLIKQSGRWYTPVPAEWPERRCITIKPGMSPGERSRRATALHTILQTQIVLAEKGMDEVLVNLDGFYRTMMDWARVSDVQNPEQYFVDPQSPAANQAKQVKAQQAQVDQAQKRALMQQALGMEQLRTATDKYKHDSELQFKYWDSSLKTEVEEAKIVGKVTGDLLVSRQKPKEVPSGQEDRSEEAKKEPSAP